MFSVGLMVLYSFGFAYNMAVKLVPLNDGSGLDGRVVFVYIISSNTICVVLMQSMCNLLYKSTNIGKRMNKCNESAKHFHYF